MQLFGVSTLCAIGMGGGYLQGVFRGEHKEYVCVQCGIGMVVGYLQVGYIQYSQVLYVYQK